MPENKNDFYLGLSIGVTVVLVFALIGVSYFAFDKNDVETNSDNTNTASDTIKKPVSPPSAPTPAAIKDISINDKDHIRGNKNAKIEIVEYSDIQCPYCSRFHDTMKQVMEKYSDKVQWVYRHFPLDSIHPVARQAAVATECAGDQGKFWEYTDELYDNQKSLSSSYLSTAAVNVGLNATQFKTCLDSGKYDDKVDADFKGGRANGVTGTPGGFINGQQLRGAESFEQMSARIESLL